MDPHFFCSNYAYKNRTCSTFLQNRAFSLSFKKTVNDVEDQWHLVLRHTNPVSSENGRRYTAIPRMRGTLIKLLVHALRAHSRASKNNWFQIVQAKKSPHGFPCGLGSQHHLLYVIQKDFTARANLALFAVVSPFACFTLTDFS